MANQELNASNLVRIMKAAAFIANNARTQASRQRAANLRDKAFALFVWGE